MSSKEGELLKEAINKHATVLAVKRATPEPATDSAEEAAIERRNVEE